MKVLKRSLITFPVNDDKTPKVAAWQKLLKSKRSANKYGIQCGALSNLLVVDVDVKGKGLIFWNQLIKKHGEIDTFTVRTPSGGLHLYFQHQEGFGNWTNCFTDGQEHYSIDIRTSGGYVVGYNSTLGGKKYEELNSGEAIVIPDWVKTYIKKRPKNKTTKAEPAELNELSKIMKLFANYPDSVNHDADTPKKIKTFPSGDLLITIKRTSGSFCEWCDRIHDSDNTLRLNFNKKLKKVWIKCQRKGFNKKSIFLGNLPVDGMPVEVKYVREYKEESFGDYKTIEFNEQYCSNNEEIMSCETDIAMKASMGSGKTHAAAIIAKKLDKKKRVLVVSFRISLTPQLRNEKYANLENIKSYLDKDKNGRKIKLDNSVNQLICQPESFYKILWTCKKNENLCDLMIIDEVGQVINQLTSDTFKKQPNAVYSFNNFKRLVRGTKQVILMDANLKKHHIDYINSLRDNPTTTVFVNKHKPFKGRKMYMVESETVIIAKARQDMERGRRVFISTNISKTRLAGIAQTLRSETKKNVLEISSDTLSEDDVKMACADPNKEWEKYDCIITSPSVQSGISYDVKKKFHSVYGIFENYTGSSTDASQMIQRIRSPINTDISVSVKMGNNTIGYCEPANLMKSKRIQMRHLKNSRRDFNRMAHAEKEKVEEFNILKQFTQIEMKNSGHIELKMNDYLRLCIDNECRANADLVNFNDNWVGQHRMEGYEIIYPVLDVKKKVLDKYKTLVKEIMDENKADRADKIHKAKTRTQKEINKIKKALFISGEITKQQLYEIAKFRTLNVFSVEEKNTDAEWFKTYENEKLQKQFKEINESLYFDKYDEHLKEIKLHEQKKINLEDTEVKDYDMVNKFKQAVIITSGKFKYQRTKIMYEWLNKLGFESLNSKIEVDAKKMKKQLEVVHGDIKADHVNVYGALEKQRRGKVKLMATKPADKAYCKDLLKFINGPLNKYFGVSVKKKSKNSTDYMLVNSNVKAGKFAYASKQRNIPILGW